MNILIIADNPSSKGTLALRLAAKSAYREGKITVLCPKLKTEWASFGRSPDMEIPWKGEDLVETEPGFHVSEVHGPCDLVDGAFLSWDLFLTRGSWNVVLTGAAHGNTLGLDVLKRSHTAAAMHAATTYGCPSMAITLPNGPDQDLTLQEENLIRDILRTSSPGQGECWSVNIPQQPTRGYIQVPAAHYSPTRVPEASIVPRSREERTDVTELKKGFVTISRLHLRINPMMRF